VNNSGGGKIDVKVTERIQFSFRFTIATNPKYYKAVLEVPSDFSGRTEIATRNGAVVISNLAATDLIIEARNGKIELSNCNAETVTAKLHNGKADFKNIFCNELALTNRNGEVSLADVRAEEKLYVINHNGSIRMSKVFSPIKELESRNGDIRLDDCSGERITMEQRNGRITVVGEYLKLSAINRNGANDVTLKGNRMDFDVTMIHHNGRSTLDGNIFNTAESYGRPGTVYMRTHNGNNRLRFV
jgi:DUF4097 and DUF4098 domain-containing protein YvlB